MCYSDHNEDIRTKGTCDYCGSDVVDTPAAYALGELRQVIVTDGGPTRAGVRVAGGWLVAGVTYPDRTTQVGHALGLNS